MTAEAPLLDTNTVSSGANFDARLVEALPMFSNMPITLSRFSPSVNVNDAQTQVSPGVRRQHVAVGGLRSRSAAGGYAEPLTPPVGGNNYTLDGANNNGSNRRIAALAQLGHDPGDARRVVELRRRRSVTASGCRSR